MTTTKPASSRRQQPRPAAAERALTTAQNAARRELAAYWLGIGVTQQRAADECGADLRTVQRWCAEQSFQDRIAQHRRTAFEQIEPQMWANVRLALDVERRMMNGELKADDPAWLAAQRLLDRFRAVFVDVDAPPSSGGSLEGPAGGSGANTTNDPNIIDTD